MQSQREFSTLVNLKLCLKFDIFSIHKLTHLDTHISSAASAALYFQTTKSITLKLAMAQTFFLPHKTSQKRNRKSIPSKLFVREVGVGEGSKSYKLHKHFSIFPPFLFIFISAPRDPESSDQTCNIRTGAHINRPTSETDAVSSGAKVWGWGVGSGVFTF